MFAEHGPLTAFTDSVSGMPLKMCVCVLSCMMQLSVVFMLCCSNRRLYADLNGLGVWLLLKQPRTGTDEKNSSK